jgi:phosphoribosylcarboxyaminoimidazole (NCAIR) mutase
VDARRDDVSAHLADIAIAAALAWGAGLRAYAVIFAVGLAGALGWVELPGHLDVLQQPVVIAASGFMTFVEFFADKLPWVDSVWDAVHSFVRVPAGAALAALAFGDSGTGVMVAAALLGGTLAGTMHAAKSASRAAINVSPEPFSNWAASLSEDALVPLGLWLAVAHPLLFFVLLAVLLAAALFLVRFLWRSARTLLR